MTKGEAREAIKEAYGNSEYTDEIIKALEQEPCEDAIRRQQAIDAIDALYLDGDSSVSYRADAEGDTLIGKYQAITVLDDLPPVTPQQKIGHWTTRPHVYGVVYCSECGFELKIDNTNYCPNCMAKMEVEDGNK